ncbi:hypothetical protein HYPSUDRAFT_461275 [Hypholoma sublateritium FD-334 SS-4]|uniref:Uncharacterized protein n=1 Tax=Hypholoma sublateritium (strain FD-334 SS-4) TaxID=945553 RepID=A0A0D2LTL6_HYPSF|nr:hypothetical protein HYPSUDRAFT_461275 [Hypholoma sublateritium FD-334 SS-4]
MGEPHDAHIYHEHTKAAGTGSFNEGSKIAVGAPTHVHVSNLNHVHPDSNLPHQLHPTDTNKLVDAVRTSLLPSLAVYWSIYFLISRPREWLPVDQPPCGYPSPQHSPMAQGQLICYLYVKFLYIKVIEGISA